MYSRNKLFSVALSREMAPNARIIAYFVAPDGFVVADSLNFHVNGSRLHEVSVLLYYCLEGIIPAEVYCTINMY